MSLPLAFYKHKNNLGQFNQQPEIKLVEPNIPKQTARVIDTFFSCSYEGWETQAHPIPAYSAVRVQRRQGQEHGLQWSDHSNEPRSGEAVDWQSTQRFPCGPLQEKLVGLSPMM